MSSKILKIKITLQITLLLCVPRVIKKTSLDAYSRPRTNGINAIGIREGDELLEAKLTNGQNEILLAIKSGELLDLMSQQLDQWVEQLLV